MFALPAYRFTAFDAHAADSSSSPSPFATSEQGAVYERS
jgi:hypothetical protein